MIVAIDIETCDDRGASFEYFRPDFRVFSLSCAWRDADGNIVHWFSTDATKIVQKLWALARSGDELVAHNLSFEYGVLTRLYPKIELKWYADTMRLAQHLDAGGAEFEAEPLLSPDQAIALELGEITEADLGKLFNKSRGLSLEACALRFLPEAEHGHKSEAHTYLTEHQGIKRAHGQYLHLLPPDILERYNNSDTRVTLLLYEDLCTRLGQFDWRRDWQLYYLRVQLMAGAYTRGIRIDRIALFTYILEIEREITEIERAFKQLYAVELTQVSSLRLIEKIEWANDPTLKSDRARRVRWETLESGVHDAEIDRFNVNSSQHLSLLFRTVLGMTPTFLTKTGQPSFKASHMHQWGPGGDILKKRKKRMMVLSQCINVYLASKLNGRVHCNVRVAGTRTNRVAGGRDG